MHQFICTIISSCDQVLNKSCGFDYGCDYNYATVVIIFTIMAGVIVIITILKNKVSQS